MCVCVRIQLGTSVPLCFPPDYRDRKPAGFPPKKTYSIPSCILFLHNDHREAFKCKISLGDKSWLAHQLAGIVCTLKKLQGRSKRNHPSLFEILKATTARKDETELLAQVA